MARRSAATASSASDVEAQIISAAEVCFTKYGVTKTTMDDIAKEAQMSRPTIYRYFQDRDRLILSVIRARAEELWDRAFKFIEKQPSFEDVLVEGLIYLVNTGRKDPIIRILVSPETFELATRLLQGSTTAVALTTELWEPVLKEAQDRGEMRADLDIGRACEWLAYVELVLVGRLDLVDPNDPGLRVMLREFLVPVFVNPDAPRRKPAPRARKSRA